MCNKMTLQVTTRSQIYYFVKKNCLLLINIIFCGFIPIYFLHNILDNIVIFKLNGSLLKNNKCYMHLSPNTFCYRILTMTSLNHVTS